MEALAGEYIRNYLHVKRFPRISLVCKLVPVQYREYEYGLFTFKPIMFSKVDFQAHTKISENVYSSCDDLQILFAMMCDRTRLALTRSRTGICSL